MLFLYLNNKTSTQKENWIEEILVIKEKNR